MNKRAIYFMLLMLVVFSLPVQSQNNKSVTVTPSPLEVKGDSIYFTVDVNLPANKKYGTEGTLQIQPTLGDYNYDLFPANPVRISGANKNGVKTSVKIAMPFIDDMIGNELDLEFKYTSADGKVTTTEIDDVTPCCITSGMLFLNNGHFVMATVEKIQNQENRPKKLLAQFNFPLDISKLDPKEYQKDIKSMGDFLKQYPNSTVTIRGFASPEGPVDRNKELSNERSKRASEWLQEQLRKAGYSKFVNPDKFSVEVTHEDWIGFLKVLQDSDKFSKHFDAVRKIVASGMEPDAMERAVLKELGYSYEQRHAPELEKLWKPLRRSVAVIETQQNITPPLSDKQVDSVVQAYMKGNIATWQLREILDQEQWLEVAQETYAESGEMSLLLGYYNVYREDYRIINDLAILDLVDQTDYFTGNGLAIIGGDDALVGVVGGEYDVKWKKDIKKDPFKFKYKVKQEDGPENEIDFVYKVENFEGTLPMLELAYKMERNDWAVLNNLGTAYVIKGNYAKGQGLLEESLRKKNTPQANYNLGLAYAQRNQMAKAVEYFNKAGNDLEGIYYNRGLAKMLNGDFAGAKKDLEIHVSKYPDMAIGHYLLAQLGARMGDENMMATHLRHAIQLKKILSDISQEDLVFKPYWDTDVFEDASDDDPKK